MARDSTEPKDLKGRMSNRIYINFVRKLYILVMFICFGCGKDENTNIKGANSQVKEARKAVC